MAEAPAPPDLFIAHGCTWQAVAAARDFGGAIGKCVKAGRVMGWETGGGLPTRPVLEEPEWVQVSAVVRVLDPEETMQGAPDRAGESRAGDA